MDAPQIPFQLYYKIGQVSEITQVKAHVLRYWEAEFKLVKPKKDRQGQRLYRSTDIEIILRIKELLYNEHYSILGAKQKLKEELAHRNEQKKLEFMERELPSLQISSVLDEHKKQIKELLNLISPNS